MKTLKIRKIFITVISSFVAISLVFSLSGCGLSSAIGNAVATLDRRAADAVHSFDTAIATLAQESADWRVVLANLQEDISEDVQSTIRTELQDLTRIAILSAGAEFRCNEEFIRIRLRNELISLRNSLAQSINATLVNTPFSNFQIPLLPEEQAEPFICDVVPAGLNLSLDAKRRSKIDIYGFDLRSLPISAGYRGYGILQLKKTVSVAEYVLLLRTRKRTPEPTAAIRTDAFDLLEPVNPALKDISNALSIISDFHAVLDLTGSGADIPPNAVEIVLSWDNRIQCEIPIMTHEKTLTCNTIEKPINPGTVTFTPPAVTNSPYGGKPDKEFKGHGPCVKLDVVLNLNPARKVLTATIYMDAWECPDDFSKIRKDYTQALGSKTITLYTAANDEKILSYNIQSTFHDQYIDNDVYQDFRYFGGTSPIEKIEYTGDTKGEEAGTRTGAKITFRPIKLQIEKCQYE